MAVKYVKDFEFPASGGFHNEAMPGRAGASAKGMPARAMPNAPARGAARMESAPKTGRIQGYAKGGKVQKYSNAGYVRRSGPLTRSATGPTSGRATYIPNPFGKSIKVYLGPTGGAQSRTPSRNPRDLFGNENPNFSNELAEMEEERRRQQTIEYARGGKVTKMQSGGSLKERIAANRARIAANKEKHLARIAAKKAGKPLTKEPLSTGVKTTSPQAKAGFTNLANRIRANKPAPSPRKPKFSAPLPGDDTPIADETGQFDPNRGAFYSGPIAPISTEDTSGGGSGYRKMQPMRKGGQMTSQDRRALDKMRHAEKYAPGLSLDMPGKRVKKK